MNTAIDALRSDDTEAWQHFIWLGVLSNDAAIAAPMAATLWDVHEVAATALLKRLKNGSLLVSSSHIRIEQRNWPTYHLPHDLRDVVRHLLTTQTIGLGISLLQAHAELLERYQSGLNSNLWHTLADDGYIHAHLTWHLKQAGWIDEIHTLLHEAVFDKVLKEASRRNGWYEACNRLGQTAIFAADVSCAWQLAEDLFEESPSWAIALQYRYALMASVLNNPGVDVAERLPVALPQELTGRQAEVSIQQLNRVLKNLNSDVRTNLLIAVRDCLPESLQAVSQNLRTKSKHKPLGTIRTMQRESDRFSALTRSAPSLRAHLMPEAFAIASAMRTGMYRVKALNVLAPKLPPNLLLEALDIAKCFQGESGDYCRAIGLSGLVSWLPERLKPEVLLDALVAARSIQDEDFCDSVYCAEALSAVSDSLPEPLRTEVLQEALDTARMVEEDWCRCNALAELAPKLPEALQAEALREALDAVMAEVEDWAVVKSLLYLLPRLPADLLLPEVFTKIRNIHSEGDRTKVLIALAPHLPSEQLLEAFTIAMDFSRKRDRLNTLIALASRMSKLQTSELFSLWKSILHALSSQTQQDFVDSVLVLIEIVYALGDREAVAEFIGAISDTTA